MTTNAFLPPKVFANAALKLLKNNLVMAKLCDSEGVDEYFKPGNGNTVYVKRPPEFIVRDGAVASPQNVVEGQVPVTINKQKGVDVQFTSMEETLNVDALLKSRILDAQMAAIATQVDLDLITNINQLSNWVGTPGNVIANPVGFFAAPQRLDEMAVPATDRNGVLTPADGYAIAGNLLASAAQQGKVASNALEKAKIPMLGNADLYMTQTIPSLVTGTRTTSAASVVNGAAQSVTYVSVAPGPFQQTLVLNGAGNAKTVAAGEVITIAGVNAVNPRTKADLGYLRQFTVVSAAVSDGAGNLSLVISPPIIADGTAFANVTAAPANGAAVTYLGAASTTFRTSAVFHKTAIKLVTAKLVQPFSGESSFATDPETGLTIRYWRYSDGTNDVHNHRFDVIYGTVCTDSRLGTRISGA